MNLKDNYTIVYEGPRQARPSATAPATPQDVVAEAAVAEDTVAEEASLVLARNLQVALAGFTLGKAVQTAAPLPTFRHISRTLRHDLLPSDEGASVVLDLANYKTSAFERRGAAHASQQLFVEGMKIGASSKMGASKLINLRSCQRLAGAIIGETLRTKKDKTFKAKKADLTNAFVQCVRVSPTQPGSGITVAETFVPGVSAKILARKIAEVSVGVSGEKKSLESARRRAEAVLTEGRISTKLDTTGGNQMRVDMPSGIHDYLARVQAGLQTKTEISKGMMIAIWDMDAKIGWLSHIIAAMNECQEELRFRIVEAPIPSSLFSSPEKVLQWARAALKARQRLSPGAEGDIKPVTVIDTDFFKVAKVVGSNLETAPDVLVGLTPAFIAGKNEYGRPFFDLFSSSRAKQMVLVTTADLRKVAESVGRTIEFAVALWMVAQVLVAVNDDLEFHAHKSNKYCMFDEPNLKQLARILRAPTVEDRCLERMRVSHRDALHKILQALDAYKRPNPSFMGAPPKEAVQPGPNAAEDEPPELLPEVSR